MQQTGAGLKRERKREREYDLEGRSKIRSPESESQTLLAGINNSRPFYRAAVRLKRESK
jgi:hypothetical protein